MTPETRRLLNPAFIATLLGYSAKGYAEHESCGLPFSFSFIIPPLVLHKDTREVLPKIITSKLSEWVHKNSAVLAFLPEHARELQPAVRSAISVGAHFDIIQFDNEGRLQASAGHDPKFNGKAASISDEVDEIMKKSHFLGRWLSISGNQPTVLSILGIGI